MADVVTALCTAGFDSPTAYAQSGNVVGGYASSTASVVAGVASRALSSFARFTTTAIALDATSLENACTALTQHAPDAVDANFHAWFLASDPAQTARESLRLLCHPTETVEVQQRIILVHAPNGIGRSKVAGAIEQVTGSLATARNRRTIHAISKLLAHYNATLRNQSVGSD